MSTVKLGSKIELSGPPWLVLSAVVVIAGAAVTIAYLEKEKS